MKRFRVLLSAYACEPGRGSEPGVGWKIAREMSRQHEVWVITRANNRPAIDEALATEQPPNLHFVYYDLPQWARWWKRRERGVQVYYYLWQLGAYVLARRLCRDVHFDLVQHVTFVKYWTPSFMSLLPIPFVWGPVGGGDSTPVSFMEGLSRRGRMYEKLRERGRMIGEHDPFVRLTARRATIALATTQATAERLRALGAGDVRTFSQVGASQGELSIPEGGPPDASGRVRFVSVGRLLALKGFHLGLKAFARLGPPDAEYWIVGDGPERRRLETLAVDLGVADRVKFWGQVPHQEVSAKLLQCAVLVHPSLHESGGGVCLEAMVCGRPVICLDLGGPALLVTEDVGIKVPATSPSKAVEGLAQAMAALASNPQLRRRMGLAARTRAITDLAWQRKADELEAYWNAVTWRSGHSP